MKKYVSLLAIILTCAVARNVGALDNPNIAKQPEAGLVEGVDKNFYGTTSSGGTNNFGTVFQVTPAGELSTLVDFTGDTGPSRGAAPVAQLILASDGNFYGTTYSGGTKNLGTVFKLTPTGILTTLVDFNGFSSSNAADAARGTNPVAGLFEDPDEPGTLYGTTSAGGAATESGTIFKITNGSLVAAYDFAGSTNGNDPEGALIKAREGSFYGTTVQGGPPPPSGPAMGTVYEFDSLAGTITTLHTFHGSNVPNPQPTPDGATPFAELIQGRAADSTLYGTTSAGGAKGAGTIFRITSSGVVTIIHSFDPSTFPTSEGQGPISGLTFGPDTRSLSFYGTTYLGGSDNLGTVYHMLVNPGPTLNTVFTFEKDSQGNAPKGRYPASKLALGTNGFYYGTTSSGGAGNGGTVFRVDANGLTTLVSFNAPAPGVPVITSSLEVTAHVGQDFNYLIQATNFPNSFDAQGLPVGLGIDKTSGVIFGKPGFPGDFPVVLSASNAGGTGTARLMIHVLPAIPVITSSSRVEGHVGQQTTYQITASNNPTSYGAEGLPPGLTLDSSTGIISGTPTQSGTFSATVSATNAGGTGTQTVTFDIAPDAPVITSPESATAVVDQQFAYQITATNSPTRFDAQGLPPGLFIDSHDGVISGEPFAAGTFTVQLSATNAGGTGTKTLVLTVRAKPPSITSSSEASGTQGQPFNYQIEADENPTSYGATGLPPGLTVDTTSGAITGMPTTTGKFAATISATNSGGTGTATLTITINAAPPGTTPTPAPAKLANLSTRGPVEFGPAVMIGGFIIQGSGSKQIVIRGMGPSLTAFGVASALQDPTLSLRDPNGNELQFNDNYTEAPQSERDILAANSLTPSDSRESAIATTLPPGFYTAILRGKTNGIGLVELYDISGNSSSRLVNVSTRAKVEEGDNGALIGGFIIEGSDPQQVAIRAIGPTLQNYGISDALADATLDIYRGSQLILSNDNWKTNSQQDRQTLQSNGLAPANDKEAAIVTNLDPGSYSAVVRGKGNTTGVALVEVYNLTQ